MAGTRISHALVALGFAFAMTASCGAPPDKSGGESRNSFTYEPNNSGGNNTPGGGTEGMEQGSPEADVRQVFNQVIPPLCAYDQTCEEPTLGNMCPTYDQYTEFAPNNCWVVDKQQASICESELTGLQCQGQWENIPLSCQIALRPCQCLEGYEQEFVNNEIGCYKRCDDGQACDQGTACYDGVCTPPQEGRCPDGEIMLTLDGEPGCYDQDMPCPDGELLANVNGEDGCYEECDVEGVCADETQVCQSGLCIPEG